MRGRRVGWILGLAVVLASAAALGFYGGRAPGPELGATLPEEPVAFRRLEMKSASTGWAVDQAGRILRTDQGPDRWVDVSPEGWPQGEGMRMAAAFLDAERAWVAAGAPEGEAGRFQIHRTRDGGQTWEAVGLIPVDERVAGESLGALQLTFVDPSRGWFLGQIHPGMHRVEPFLYATQDGGESWELVMGTLPSPQGDVPEHTLQGSYSAPYGSEVMAFLSPTKGYAGTGPFQVTSTGGREWQAVELPAPPDPPELEDPFTYARPPRFTSEEEGHILVDLYEFEDVYCPPCDRFGAPPAATYLYATSDGGEGWQVQEAPVPGGNAAFINACEGWYLGEAAGGGEEHKTVLYATEDGGRNWQALTEEPPFAPDARLIRIEDRVGFAWHPDPPAGSPGLYATQDGGRQWESVEPHRASETGDPSQG